MSLQLLRSVLLGVATLLVTTTGALATPSPRSDLYSLAAANRYCTAAQQKLVGITRRSINIVHYAYPGSGGIIDFTFSSAAPYEGPNVTAYNGKETTGSLLALTTQQMVTYREVWGTDYEIPVLFSCKMKNAEAINFHFPGSGAVQSTCKAINQDMANKVYASLTNFERRYLKHQQADIVFDDDEFAISGPSWLGLLPSFLPSPAYIGGDMKLHIYGEAIEVARGANIPGVGQDKEGSYYCHLIAPEYFRGLITGQIASPY
jgi:hypothetical protein